MYNLEATKAFSQKLGRNVIVDLFDLFKKYLLEQKVAPSESTIKNYLADVRRLQKWFTEKQGLEFDPKLISPTHIENFKLYLQGISYTPATIERHLSSLRKFFQFLQASNVIAESPLDKITSAKDIKPDPFRLKEFKNFLYLSNKEPATIKNYLLDLESFLSWLEKVSEEDFDVSEKARLGKINPLTINEYKDRLLNVLKLSPRSVNRKLSSLRQYCQWAKNQGYLKENPFEISAVEPAIDPELKTSPIKAYSSLPPIRLIQKVLRGLDLLLTRLLIAPIGNLLLWFSPKTPTLGLFVKAPPKSAIENIKKQFYAPTEISLASFPFHKKLLHHLRFTRPNWYKRYHQSPISHYLHGAILVIAAVIIGFIAYQRLFPPPTTQVLTTSPPAERPTKPPFIFSGRLLDRQGNPVTVKKLVIFSFYEDPIRFDKLIHQEVHEVTPDAQGFFTITLDNLPKAVSQSTVPIYLGLTIKGDAEMRPRQLVNGGALTGQAGLLPIPSSLDENGNLIITQESPSFTATSGTFTLSGSSLMLRTTEGSDGSISLWPDGLGKIDVLSPLTNSITGTVSINDALSIDYNGISDPFSLSIGGVASFWIDNQGNVTNNGNLSILGQTNLLGNLIVSGNTTLLGSFENLSTGGLYAIWYDDSQTQGEFKGRPLKQTVLPTVSLYDFSLPGSPKEYSVKVVGFVRPSYSEEYTFYVTSTDGTRLWVNHSKLIDDWRDQNETTHEGKITLTKDRWYPIILEHFQNNTLDRLKLEWSSSSQTRQVIPSKSLAYSLSEVPQTLFSTLRTDSDLFVGGGINVSGSITPQASANFDLGSLQNYWKNFYVNNIYTQGNVGIGTSSPSNKLSVAGTLDITGGNLGIGTTSPVYLFDAQGGTGIVGRFSGRVIGADAVNNNEFVTLSQVTSSAGGWTDDGTVVRLTTASDNVGIGTTSPAYNLQVVGTANVTGSLTVGSSTTISNGTISQSSGETLTIGTTAADLLLTTTTSGDIALFPRGGNVGIGTSSPAGTLQLASGQLLLPDGTNTAPSLTFTNDTDTGLYRIDSNRLSLVTAGASALTINSLGNLGVGTTNPLTKLHVEGQCVAKGTRIRRRKRRRQGSGDSKEDGDWEEEVPVEHIQPGDEVLSLNELTQEFAYQRVEKLLDMGRKPVFELTTLSGKKIKTTGEHPYLVKDASGKVITHQSPIENAGWVKVTELKSGDKIAVADSTFGGFSSKGNVGQRESNNKKGEEDQRQNIRIPESSKIHHILRLNQYAKSNDTIPNKISNVKTTILNEGSIPGNTGETIATPTQKTEKLISQSASTESNTESILPISNNSITETDTFQWLAMNAVEWDSIVSIEYVGEEHVYDLQISNTHNFLANGIVAHNTYISGNLGIGTSSPAGTLQLASGQLLVADGTNSLPSLSFGNDTDTGLYRIDTNRLSLVTGGASALTINSSGNVGIGTTSPGFKLDVAGGGRFNCGNTTWNTGPATSCSDIAEVYDSDDPTLEPGDVVVIGTSKVAKSQTVYQPQIIGVFSTSPGLLVGGQTILGGETQNLPAGKIPVALSGRAPLKVSTENGPIEPGDFLTSSSIPGVAMKATRAGAVVGKALESFSSCHPELVSGSSSSGGEIPNQVRNDTGETCQGKILAFVNVSFYDPDVLLTSTGDLIIKEATYSGLLKEQEIRNTKYEIRNTVGEVIQRIGVFSDAIIANLRAGYVHAQALTVAGFIEAKNITTGSLTVATDSVTIGGQNLRDYIASVVSDTLHNSYFILHTSQILSPLAEIDTVKTNILSPLSSDTVVVDGKLTIRESSPSASPNDIVLEVQGNATFSGQLSSNILSSNEATISGTLRAGKIVADNIEALQAQIASLAAETVSSNKYQVASIGNESSPGSILNTEYVIPNTLTLEASSSATLNIDRIFANTGSFLEGLLSIGPAGFSDVSITGILSLGSQFILNDNSINVLGADLKLQPLGQGGVSIADGKVYIDSSGNLKVSGNLAVEGDATFSKDIKVGGKLSTNIISPIPYEDLIIRLSPSVTASEARQSQEIATGSANSRNDIGSNFIIQNSSGSAVLRITDQGDLTASGSALFRDLTTQKLTLPSLIEKVAADGQSIQANGTVGKGTIVAGTYEVTIETSFVTKNSLIYITPTSDTGGFVPYIARQVEDESFTVGINDYLENDITFNWWIIN